ncbi:MAG: Transcriptional regulator, TetR family protein [Symbiobacteriaceae bacterium]|jgi:AcrR family transcriptional regulator|nr:Transcriptional regulator, TetR family protein [Symbiobacteriaceae bacterium]
MGNQANKEEKRAVILGAALELFADRGYHATNVPNIAERAGISVGTLYHYFDSKEKVVNELYRKLKREMMDAFWTDFPAEAAPVEQFRAFWQRGVAFAEANRLAFTFLEFHHHAPYLDDESRSVQKRAAGLEARLFEAGRRAGAVQKMPDAVLSAFIGGALVSLIKSAWDGQIPLTPAVVEQAAARCWDAIRDREKGQMPQERFSLAGEHGRVTIGFEPNTAGRAVVDIESWNYRATGKAWIDMAAVRQFRADLQRCYDTLKGEARLASSPEENLVLTVSFDRRGNAEIRGAYRETLAEENELRFRVQTDQTYVVAALAGLGQVLGE